MAETTNSKARAKAGELIAERMKALELTNEVLADMLGLAEQSNVSQWRKGRRGVPVKQALRLAQILGVDDPARVCPEWTDMMAATGLEVDAAAGPQTPLRRLEADIDELREWVAAVVTTLARHAPVASAEIELMMSDRAESHLSRGLRRLLLDEIGKARRESASARRSVRPRVSA